MNSATATARTPCDVPTRAERGGLLALGVLSTLLLYWRFRELRHDDAFITFQYARNLATGNGFVFNPEERILGTTSPLHTLLMAAGHLLTGGALPQFAIAVGTLGTVAQAGFSYLLIRERSRPLAALCALLLAAGFGDGLAFLALETNVFAGLVLGVVWAVHARRAVVGGLLLGLAFLCRYDAALLVPVFAFSWWLRWRELPRVSLGVSFAVVAPWLLWATWYFGSFLPQTFFAKQQITPSVAYLSHYLEFFAEAPARVLFGGAGPALMGVASAVAMAAGFLYALSRTRALLPLFAFAALLLFAYARMGPHFLQHWHLYPVLLTAQLAFAMGLAGWAGEVAAAMPARKAVAGILGAVALLLVARTATVQLGRSEQLVAGYWFGGRDARYRQIAAWLSEHVRADSALLALEVGTLGYYSKLRMIDPYGLINDTNSYPRDPTLESLLELVQRYQPDVLVVNTPYQGAVIERLSDFRRVKVFPSDPASTLLVRGQEVLNDADAYPRLRAEAAWRDSAAGVDAP